MWLPRFACFQTFRKKLWSLARFEQSTSWYAECYLICLLNLYIQSTKKLETWQARASMTFSTSSRSTFFLFYFYKCLFRYSRNMIAALRFFSCFTYARKRKQTYKNKKVKKIISWWCWKCHRSYIIGRLSWTLNEFFYMYKINKQIK